MLYASSPQQADVAPQQDFSFASLLCAAMPAYFSFTEQSLAAYDSNVAGYRQSVLTAFQEVEDNLAALRILSREREQQEAAIKSSERTVELANDRYKAGIDSYLNVITAQTTLLTNQRTEVNLQMEQMTASVELIKALGGGWNSSQLPTPKQLTSK